MRIRLLHSDGSQDTFRNDDQTAAVGAVLAGEHVYTYSHSVSDHAAERKQDQTIFCYRPAAVVVDFADTFFQPEG